MNTFNRLKSRHGFDDLRRGQVVEYTLENGPYLRANFVHVEGCSREGSQACG